MLDHRIITALTELVGPDSVISSEDELRVYECDGSTLEKRTPSVVVLPGSPAEVAAVVRLLHRERVAFVPRGAGTGLSGGCLTVGAPVVICASRLNRILEVDFANRRAVVEPGVVNLWVTRAVEGQGMLYAPDPSSQPACTIGGNVAENSGGAHTLKYGATTNHVLGLDLVLPDGELVQLGGAVEDVPGYDLVGLTVGSEGTFGIVTRVVLRLVRKPESWKTILAVFETVDDACNAVSAIISAGMVPAALEMMDRVIIDAVEAAYHFGFPDDAGAVLIVELDGPAAGLDEQARRAAEICRTNRARELKVADDEVERAALWQSRKRAFGAMGRLAPNYCTQDGVVPRTRLPEILRTIATIAQRYRLRIGNVFHAGDGNIHPILLYDERDTEEVRRVLDAGREILAACVALGGTVTGEHGIGCEKVEQMPLIFTPHDLLVMQQLRAAFDPGGRCNPGKVFPAKGGSVGSQKPVR
jgi:glycolate oxidase